MESREREDTKKIDQVPQRTTLEAIWGTDIMKPGLTL